MSSPENPSQAAQPHPEQPSQGRGPQAESSQAESSQAESSQAESVNTQATPTQPPQTQHPQTQHPQTQPHQSIRGHALRGAIRVAGDKSISHRSLILGALAVGETRIHGMLEGHDVLSTAAALRQMGVIIERSPPLGSKGAGEDRDDDTGEAHKDGNEEASGEASEAATEEAPLWRVRGVGVGGLLQPGGPLNMGNSGTSARLLMGLVASHGISAEFIGDASLSARPMGRVIAPLSQMGANITASEGGTFPLKITGALPATPITYRLPMASAQVKSAILLAALNTPGISTVIEPTPTRDHSERMLRGFGAELSVEMVDDERHITLRGGAASDLLPQELTVPGDPSSAAFFVVAALLVEGSDLIIENVGLNPTRAGLFTVLEQMGGSIERLNMREIGGEPVADLRVRHSKLHGIVVDPEIAPSMIDEFPVLFVAAALAQGTTTCSGLEELRVKESDRLAIMATALTSIGVKLRETEDGLVIQGTGGEPLPGNAGGQVGGPTGGPDEDQDEAAIATHLDHRIAMSMIVAGLASRDGVVIDDISPIATSFPNFLELLEEASEENQATA